jgi:hypothetical protein
VHAPAEYYRVVQKDFVDLLKARGIPAAAIGRHDTTNGAVRQVTVGAEPHGLTVWPQPGRYSLGHTGNLR